MGENKHAEEIEKIRAESEAQKSALESEITSLKEQIEKAQTDVTSKEEQNKAVNGQQDKLDSCKARVVELQEAVKALEDHKLGSQTKESELMDAASSLRQQLQDAQTESESLTIQVKKQAKSIAKLEEKVTKTTAAHEKMLSQCKTLSKQQERTEAQS